eukprot:GHVH01008862.1.p1 GENE.GHVH01008862.1~~GHVH01008862.1.p1  ORF type:complete len:927 (-),score=123.82 GHVH01008862.1:322-3102(-)
MNILTEDLPTIEMHNSSPNTDKNQSSHIHRIRESTWERYLLHFCRLTVSEAHSTENLDVFDQLRNLQQSEDDVQQDQTCLKKLREEYKGSLPVLRTVLDELDDMKTHQVNDCLPASAQVKEANMDMGHFTPRATTPGDWWRDLENVRFSPVKETSLTNYRESSMPDSGTKASSILESKSEAENKQPGPSTLSSAMPSFTNARSGCVIPIDAKHLAKASSILEFKSEAEHKQTSDCGVFPCSSDTRYTTTTETPTRLMHQKCLTPFVSKAHDLEDMTTCELERLFMAPSPYNPLPQISIVDIFANHSFTLPVNITLSLILPMIGAPATLSHLKEWCKGQIQNTSTVENNKLNSALMIEVTVLTKVLHRLAKRSSHPTSFVKDAAKVFVRRISHRIRFGTSPRILRQIAMHDRPPEIGIAVYPILAYRMKQGNYLMVTDYESVAVLELVDGCPVPSLTKPMAIHGASLFNENPFDPFDRETSSLPISEWIERPGLTPLVKVGNNLLMLCKFIKNKYAAKIKETFTRGDVPSLDVVALSSIHCLIYGNKDTNGLPSFTAVEQFEKYVEDEIQRKEEALEREFQGEEDNQCLINRMREECGSLRRSYRTKWTFMAWHPPSVFVRVSQEFRSVLTSPSFIRHGCRLRLPPGKFLPGGFDEPGRLFLSQSREIDNIGVFDVPACLGFLINKNVTSRVAPLDGMSFVPLVVTSVEEVRDVWQVQFFASILEGKNIMLGHLDVIVGRKGSQMIETNYYCDKDEGRRRGKLVERKKIKKSAPVKRRSARIAGLKSATTPVGVTPPEELRLKVLKLNGHLEMCGMDKHCDSSDIVRLRSMNGESTLVEETEVDYSSVTAVLDLHLKDALSFLHSSSQLSQVENLVDDDWSWIASQYLTNHDPEDRTPQRTEHWETKQFTGSGLPTLTMFQSIENEI